MPTWMWLVLLAVVTFFTRALPRLICPKAQGFDTWFHLLAAKRIRENHLRIPKSLEGCLIPHVYNYPPLLHYVLALFPKNFRDKYVEPFIGAFIDLLLSILLFCFAYYFSLKWFPNIAPKNVAILATILFITIPALTAEFTGPRSTSATARPIGELFFTLSFVFAAIYYWDSNIWSLILCGIFAGLIPITSKFGTQALLFISILTGVMLKFWLLVALPFIGLVIALIISKGHYAKIFSGQIQHLTNYFKTVQKTFSFTSDRNRLEDIKSLPIDLFKNPRKAFRTLIFCNSYSIAVLRIPLLVFIIFIVVNNTKFLFVHAGNRFITFWLIASIIVFLLTSLRPFLFLGEAERYLEFATFPVALLPSLYVINNDNKWIWGFFGIIQFYSLLQMIFNYYMFIRRRRRKIGEDELLHFLQKQEKANIIIMPVHLLGYRIPYETKHSILRQGGSLQGIDFQWFYAPYPLINSSNLREIIWKFDIRFVLHDSKTSAKHNILYDFSFLSLIFKQDEIEVYALSKGES